MGKSHANDAKQNQQWLELGSIEPLELLGILLK
jgi:hypothetical protein